MAVTLAVFTMVWPLCPAFTVAARTRINCTLSFKVPIVQAPVAALYVVPGGMVELPGTYVNPEGSKSVMTSPVAGASWDPTFLAVMVYCIVCPSLGVASFTAFVTNISGLLTVRFTDKVLSEALLSAGVEE